VIGWCIALFAVVITGFVVGQRNHTDLRLPGTPAQAANDLIYSAFPGQRGDTEAIVVSTPAGTLSSGAGHERAERLFAVLRGIPGVVGVTDPLAGGRNAALSLNHKTAIAVLRFRQDSLSVPTSETTALIHAVNASRTATFDTAAMGWALEDATVNPPVISEIVGLVAAAVVLLLAFGSGVAVLVAMGSALVALGLSFGLLEIASHLIDIPYYEPQIALTIGLGVGIDYGLLTVARYRGVRQRAGVGSRETVDALARTGRTVTFAGCTVILAMIGLLVTPMSLVRGMTIGVVIAVVPTVLCANSLLPALLQLTDRQLDQWRPWFLRDRKLVERSQAWANWSARMQRRPLLAALGALAVLGILATPIFWLRLGPADGSTDNPASMTNRAYRLASAGFGPGVTSPLDVVATFPSRVDSDSHAIQRVRDELLRTPDVMYVAPQTISPDRRNALFHVIPASAPDAVATSHLLDQLRTTVATRLAAHDIDIGVGGQAAIQLTISSTIMGAFPLTVLTVIGSSFILLLLQFRSIVIALKAGLMNLLSISAAFGIVVAVFEWGWGRQLIGVDHAGPLQSFLPLLLFPAIFGLSMDYEVFLMSRMTDEWERTHDSTHAITEGVATTGRVVTSGAAIMFALFSAMALSGSRTVELFGVGLATAVLLDATVIRSILLPATMQLLGRHNWWMPRWMRARLPLIRPA
jgi:RND superfamily putative drug exporter